MRNISLFASAATIAAAMLFAGPVPLAAQDAPAARPAATWSHDLSGMTLPMTVAGFERGQSKQYDDQGYNIGVSFRDDASGSWADLFIYKAAPASVAVWGDRAAAGMFANPMLGDVDLAAIKVASFTPPNGAGVNSGLRIVAPLASDLTASGLAIYIHDGWLVKLRMSSRTLDADMMEARMAEFVTGLALPPASRPAPAFTEISDCAVPLKAKKKAKLMRLDMMGNIMLGATLGVTHNKKLEEASADSDATPSVWCRDAASQPRYGVYRREGSDDSYLIGVGDTGTSLSVGSYDLGPLMKPSRGFLVTQSDGVTEQVYPPFDRMPAPEQVLGLPGNVGPVFSAGLLPGNTGSTVNVQTK